MAEALTAYKELQRMLDASMPDQLMQLGDKTFRKKGFWRAVAVAFNIDVELVEERRESDGVFEDGRENFGYLVTYRAKAPNGRSEPGDGACFAIEKAAKFKCPHPEREGSTRTLHYPHDRCPDFDPNYQWRKRPAEASVHNVRSHAHTRAFNRAVSNLCGFGEVSAEEVERDEHEPRAVGNGHTAQARPPMQPPQRRSDGANAISEPQRRRMYAIAKDAGWSDDEYRAHVTKYGFERDEFVTRDVYEGLCTEFQRGTNG
jgi:hypothetical protein